MKAYLAAAAAIAFLSVNTTHAQGTQSGEVTPEIAESIANIEAMADIIDNGIVAYDAGEYALALDIWLSLAEEVGNVDAEYNIGLLYYGGLGVLEDKGKAAQWYRLAAEQGHVLAQYVLGFMYDRGQGVLKDKNEAARWFRLAAKQGHPIAQLKLGLAYQIGDGVPEDKSQAARLFREAAASEVEDRYRLAVDVLAIGGRSAVERQIEIAEAASRAGDYVTAFEAWLPSAAAGFDYAQNIIGGMYYSGKGVVEDKAEAAVWYRLAAERGNVDAQATLGVMYANGKGVPQDDGHALRLTRQASEQGHEIAQAYLGSMYADGRGVLQNYILAHMWFNLASANGEEIGRDFRDEIAEFMSSADISTAQEKARICMESNYQDCD